MEIYGLQECVIKPGKCDTRFSSIKNFRDDTIRGIFNRDKNIKNYRSNIDRFFDTIVFDSFRYNYRSCEHDR